MRALPRLSAAAAAALAALGAITQTALAVNQLSYDELISVVFFESEKAYLDPTGFFCQFIALSGKDDYCKVSLTSIDPRLCKVEVTREMRVTHSEGKGRDFFRSRDVFVLAHLELEKLVEPEVDYEHKSSRQTFTSPLNIKWHEGETYSVTLDASGAYKTCVIGGEEKVISEADCVKAGQEPMAATRSMSLLFSNDNYNRSMAAIRWLQKSFCTRGDEL